MNRRRFLAVLGGSAATLASPISLAAAAADQHEMVAACFGSKARILVRHPDKRSAEEAMQSAFRELNRIESIMSVYRPNSQLSLLNRTGQLNAPDPSLEALLREARELSVDTDAAFDVTVQPLWNLFAAAKAERKSPTELEVEIARRRVDYRNIVLHQDRIELRNGAQVTLNGIAQGFATDRAKQILADHGIQHAILDIGEVAGLGAKSSSKPWQAGIQHPRAEDAFSAIVFIEQRCLATSGDYHTTFSDDFRCHHIFDPQSGRSPQELSSVSVFAPRAATADALSTALMVLGIEKGAKLLARHDHVDALFVRKDGSTIATQGFPLGAIQ